MLYSPGPYSLALGLAEVGGLLLLPPPLQQQLVVAAAAAATAAPDCCHLYARAQFKSKRRLPSQQCPSFLSTGALPADAVCGDGVHRVLVGRCVKAGAQYL